MQDKRGNLFIISAPSGAGKTTLVQKLLAATENLQVSISHTTRPRRPGEQDGRDYHFIDEAAFHALINAGEFLEHARVFDHYYGTSRARVEQQLGEGRDIILEIDWQGARQVREQLPEAVGIFILPPSYGTLQARLAGRGDDADSVRRRMDGAARELSHYREYDFLIINDDLERAGRDLAAVIRAAGQDYHRQQAFYDAFLEQMLSGQQDIQ